MDVTAAFITGLLAYLLSIFFKVIINHDGGLFCGRISSTFIHESNTGHFMRIVYSNFSAMIMPMLVLGDFLPFAQESNLLEMKLFADYY